jgi:SAM-dependent methyltransferase
MSDRISATGVQLSQPPDRRGALDIGAGDGVFLDRLIDCGFSRVCGVEPSVAPIEAAKPSVRSLIRRGLFDPAAFEPDSFSLITCFQVMEHLWDPLDVCRGPSNSQSREEPWSPWCTTAGRYRPGCWGPNLQFLTLNIYNCFQPPAAAGCFVSPDFLTCEQCRSGIAIRCTIGSSSSRSQRQPRKWLCPTRRKARAFQIRVPLPAGNLLVWGLRPKG